MRIIILFLFFAASAFANVEVINDRISITNDKDFESKLELKNFTQTNKEASFTLTGFIVSSTQYNFENDRFVNKWVSLEDKVLKNNNVDLKEVKPDKDLAYGVVSTSKDFEKDLKIGQNVVIQRYGIKGDHFNGKIIKLIPMQKQDLIQVHFLAYHSPELISGTTCEVEISQIKKTAYVVSLLSILHLGLEDYIVIKEGSGVYRPKHVTVLEQNFDKATILVNVPPTLPYVARGAILLKPLINDILKEKGPAP